MSHKKRLISNFFSLSSVQFVNYVLPLITVPYLVRVLGPEKFGLIAFAQAFIQYFVLITDYGFNLSATREVSVSRNDKEKVSEIFSAVMLIKTALMISSFLVLTILVFSISKFKEEWLIYVLTFGRVLGNVLFPVWIFQGMEKMKQMSVLNLLSKAIFTVAIFIFIKSKGDYIYIPLINSLGFVVAGLLSLWIVIRRFGVKVKIPTRAGIKHEVKEGWHIFVSTIVMSFYTVSNTFILGLFTNNTVVGYYSAGEKIVRAVQGVIIPVSQTIYPHISKLASESIESALTFIRKIIKLVGIPAFILSLALFMFAPQITDIILGKQFKESISVIHILAFLPLLVGLSNIFGVQVMLNFGLKKIFTKIIIMASFVNILLALILVVPLQYIGISISLLFTEIFVTFFMFLVLQKRGIRVFEF